MLPTDSDLIFGLKVPTGNDHRNTYSVHIWNSRTNGSQIRNFYAYTKSDASSLAREYIVRFMDPDYQIVSIRKEEK